MYRSKTEIDPKIDLVDTKAAAMFHLQHKKYTTTPQQQQQGRRGRGEEVGQWGTSPSPFPGAKTFFPLKIGKHKTFTCE